METTNGANGEASENNADTSPKSEAEEEVFSWTKQWYPVLPESYLSDKKPAPIAVLGRDLVIWKTAEGGISVLEDSCPHRRAPLSTGKIVGDRLACRYHGWEFDVSGSCTKIPMDVASQKYVGKFCAKSYHAQIEGGLLWIFMDDAETNPPPVPQEIVNENTAGWMMYVSPVSFLSQIENTFDPTHAPFTHEGQMTFGGSSYAPENAVPMERYELTEPLSSRGFALEHSPYQKTPHGVPEMFTTRQFVPPCTSITKSPKFSANLHFVPSKPGETIVVAQFGGGSPKKKNSTLRRLLPNRLKVAMKDFTHYWFQVSDRRYKFLMQDQLTMQGQDCRKVMDQKWDDLTPTTSDAGVKAMQRWMRRYGGFGPFPLLEMSAHQGKEMSVWDSHGRYSPQFHAAMKRLVRVEKMTNKISAISMGSSLLGVVASGLSFAIQRRARLSTGLLISTLTFLVLSSAARVISQLCSKLLAKAIVTKESDAHLETMETFAS